MKENHLLILLQRKKGFFEAILELAETESNLSLSDWVCVLEQKKILLACIEEVDEELAHFKDAFHTLSHDVHEELEHIKKIVERLLHLDTLHHEKRKQECLQWKKQQ